MDVSQYLRFVVALIFVLGLILSVAWALRRFGGAAALRLGRGTRRLTITETIALDTRRRLVLVRRDGVEHLLLLGPTGDLVVERAIGGEDRAADFPSHLGEPD